jgi:hypothetical protein
MKRVFVFAVASLLSGAAFAQQVGDPGVPYEFKKVGISYEGITSPAQLNSFARIQPMEGGYGIADYSFISISASGFAPNGSNISGIDFSGNKSYTSGNTIQYANVELPQGANIDGMTVWGTDGDAASNILFELRRFNIESPATSVVVASHTSSGTGNVALFVASAVTEHVDNYRRNYGVWVNNSSSLNSFRGVTIWFHRRILPAPASASFEDVPTGHGFFQFVEALKASGITTGCTDATHFCPDLAVTRGQMAAFLARALGLHWSSTVVP